MGSICCHDVGVRQSTARRPALVLLALSPLAMFWLFARERKQRMDETLALSTAHRGTALLLGDVVEADHEYTDLRAQHRTVLDLPRLVGRELDIAPHDDAAAERHIATDTQPLCLAQRRWAGGKRRRTRPAAVVGRVELDEREVIGSLGAGATCSPQSAR